MLALIPLFGFAVAQAPSIFQARLLDVAPGNTDVASAWFSSAYKLRHRSRSTHRRTSATPNRRAQHLPHGRRPDRSRPRRTRQHPHLFREDTPLRQQGTSNHSRARTARLALQEVRLTNGAMPNACATSGVDNLELSADQVQRRHQTLPSEGGSAAVDSSSDLDQGPGFARPAARVLASLRAAPRNALVDLLSVVTGLRPP